MKSKLKRSLKLYLRSWIGSMVIALLIATSFKSAIADWYEVPSGSMKPTILEGDRIFVNKLAYDLKIPYTTWHITAWDNPSRGDIIVFYSPVDGTRLVKRVVGLPGDSIAMHNNRLYVNGASLQYRLSPDKNNEKRDGSQSVYIENLLGRRHPVMVSSDPLPYRFSTYRSFGPIIIPRNRYFVLGDNRDNSADSRYFGFVDRESILGKAVGVAISIDLTDHYRPRWQRFFTKLP